MPTRLSILRTMSLGSLLALLALAACVPLPVVPVSPIVTPPVASAVPSQPVPEKPMPSTTVPSQEITPAATGALRPAAVELAVADLAGQLGIAAEAITVRSVEAVEWSDASLGCPEPGMMYAQVITPGYRIVLEANGQSYEYHSGRSSTIVRCKP
jgi:hypothetical protein